MKTRILLAIFCFVYIGQIVGQSITLTSPIGGETLYYGFSHTISWSSDGLSNDYVSISYSENNGDSWNHIQDVINSGSYSWTIPNIESDDVLLKVSEYNNSAIFDVSNANFSIKKPFINITSPTLSEIIEGCSIHRISFNSGGISDYANFYYSIDNGLHWIYIGNKYVRSNKYYDWSVPSFDLDNVLIKVTDNSNTSIFDISEAFEISPGLDNITITSPNGGEIWSASSLRTITWDSEGAVGNISIRYSRDGGVNWDWVRDIDNNVANNIINSGSFEWLVPKIAASSKMLIQVYEYSANCKIDFSDNMFTIDNSPSITIRSPKPNDIFYVNKSYNIQWDASNLPTNYVSIDYSIDNGDNWIEIVNSVSSNSSHYWQIPNTPSEECLIRVRARDNSSIYDISSERFTIRQPHISITTPSESEVIEGCTTYRVNFEREGISNYIRFYYSIDDGANWIHFASPGISLRDYYDWVVPSLTVPSVKIKIADDSDLSVFDVSDSFVISPSSDKITITSPNGGETWSASSIQTITWDSEGTVGNVSIRYSANGGSTWDWVRDINNTAANNIGNSGSFEWLVPKLSPSANMLIQIYDNSSNCKMDYSDNMFTIDNSPSITIRSPKENNIWYVDKSYSIEWNASNLPTNYVSIDYSIDNGNNWTEITNSVSSNSSHYWTIPNTPSEECLIRVKARDDNDVYTISETFTIKQPFINITSPIESEVVDGCETYRINFEAEGIGSYVRLYYSFDDGATWIFVETPYIASRKYYDWTVPSLDISNIKIKLADDGNLSVFGISDAFEISPGSDKITITSPNGGETWSASSLQTITWDNDGTVGNVSIKYSANGGTTWEWVRDINSTAANNIANSGSFEWLVPKISASTNMLIHIYDYYSNCKMDYSDNKFTIDNSPSITVRAPQLNNIWYVDKSYSIQWNASNLPTNYVSIDYSIDNGDSWTEIVNSVSASSSYYWTIPDTPSEECLIRVKARDDNTLYAISEGVFIIKNPFIDITSISEGQIIPGCTTHRIQWNSEGTSTYIKLYYSLDDGNRWIYSSSPYIGSSKYYDWVVPAIDSENFRIKIVDDSNSSVFSVSEKFSITSGANSLTLITPNGSEEWPSRSLQNIEWSTSGVVNNITLRYSTNGGNSWDYVRDINNSAANNIANNNSYEWLLPANINSSNSLIQIYEYNNSCIIDYSDNYFTINRDPMISITSPSVETTYYFNETKRISWYASNLSTNYVNIDYSVDGGSSWISIIESRSSSSGYYDWVVPTEDFEEVYVRVKSRDDEDIYAVTPKIAIKTPRITVLTPNNGDENWLVGENRTITWSTAGLGTTDKLKIEYSVDNGENWDLIVDNYNNSKSYIWTIPLISTSSQVLVKVTSEDFLTSFDINDKPFTITKPIVGITVPNDGQVWYVGESKAIEWTGLVNAGNVKIDFSRDNGSSFTNIVASAPNNGFYYWNIPYSIEPSEECLIAVTSLVDASITDTTDITFTIAKPIINITKPNGGEMWYLGQTQSVEWTNTGVSSSKVNVEYSIDEGNNWILLANIANNGSYSWSISSSILPSENALIRVSNEDDNSINSISENYFEIIKPSISITSPNGGETIYKGQTHNIRWNKDGAFSPNVKIEYSINNGANWSTIIESVTNSESYLWNVPFGIDSSEEFLIKISDSVDNTIFDVSSDNFTVKNPIITVLEPNGGEIVYPNVARNVRWQSVALSSTRALAIEYSSDGGATWDFISNSLNGGSYSWTPLSMTYGSDYLIKVYDVNYPEIVGVSQSTFILSKPEIEMVAPNGSEVWYQEQVKLVKWNSIALPQGSNVKIEYTENNGQEWNLITASTPNSGNYEWEIPSTLLSNTVKVRVSSVDDNTIYDISANNFKIALPKAGDRFDSAIELGSLPFEIKDTTSLYSNQFAAAENEPSPDVFYSFVVPEKSDSIEISILANYQSKFHIISDESNVIATSKGGYVDDLTLSSLILNNQYYIVVEGTDNSQGAFTLKGKNYLPYPDLAVENVVSSLENISPKDTLDISWKISNVGEGTAIKDWKERIYIQSVGGTDIILLKEITTNENDELIGGNSINRSEEVTLPSLLNQTDEVIFVVEIIPGNSLIEVKDGSENNFAVTSNHISINKKLSIELLTSEITEGATSPISVKIIRSGDISEQLTVNLSSDLTDRITYPATVTIPADQSSAIFYINAPDNERVEGTKVEEILLSANSYPTENILITVFDNDKATLSFTDLPAVVDEGDTFTFKVNSNLIASENLDVFLLSNSNKRFPLPNMVTILAGESYAEIEVTITQNNIPEVDFEAEIIASANNHHNATGNIIVLDDDVPSIELIVGSTTISEGAGGYATQAVIRRTGGDVSQSVRVNISASVENQLILPTSITLGKGEVERGFYIGTVDNSMVDGDREVDLIASVFIGSCGCNADIASSGTSVETLTITDDDGPALTLTLDNLTLPEGYSPAGNLRISRNTSTEAELSVELSSSNISEATVPSNATIPVGQLYIDVPITTIDDGITDGNQEVYFYATASGFSTGSVWAIVTDQNLPDLTIPVSSISQEEIKVNDILSYEVLVENSGFATAPRGVVVKGYLTKGNIINEKSLLITEDVITEPIHSGESYMIQNVVTILEKPDDYNLIFLVNPEGKTTELLSTNNTSSPESLFVLSDFYASATVNGNYFIKGETIEIYGTAAKLDGSPLVNRDIDVYVITQNYRRVIPTKSDENGNYIAEFVPLTQESGYYIVGATYPDVNSSAMQDDFNILGVTINKGRVPEFKLDLTETLTGTLKLENLSKQKLNNLRIESTTLPEGANIEFEVIGEISSYGTVNIGYEISGDNISLGHRYDAAMFKVISDEGEIQDFKLYYYCQAPNALLTSSVERLNVATSSIKAEKVVEVEVTNNGAGSTGNVYLNIPDVSWLKSITPKTLPSLETGESHLISLKFIANDEIPFDYPISGHFSVSSDNSPYINVPFSFTKTASSKGAARVQVTNQFTYYTEDEPMVEGAYVKISNYFSGVVLAEGYTDENGEFYSDDIPEGKHRIVVKKDKHLDYNSTIVINPGAETLLPVFLNYQAITFDWVVIPTAIEDVYDITLTVEFETHVPAPVVTIDIPKTMPKLVGGEIFAFNAIITNHGLIRANDLELTLPTGDAEYYFETNYVTADLPAQSSIQVPIVMKRRDYYLASNYDANNKKTLDDISDYLGIQKSPGSPGGGGCSDFVAVAHWYKCGSNGLWQNGGQLFSYEGRSCGSGSVGSGGGYFGGGSDGGGACSSCGASGGGGGSSGGSASFQSNQTSCAECINSLIGAGAGCIGADVIAGVSCFINFGAFGGSILECIPLPPPIGCPLGILSALKTCLNTEVEGAPSQPKLKSAGIISIYSYYDYNLLYYIDYVELFEKVADEYFGDINKSDAFNDLIPFIEPYFESMSKIPNSIRLEILDEMNGYELSQSSIIYFVERWNNSIDALNNNVLEPNDDYPDIINWEYIKSLHTEAENLHNISINRGYESVVDMYLTTLEELDVLTRDQSAAVCASVKVQFSQQLTMTREAFEGTLDIFNGHPTDAMESIEVVMVITDENGNPSNGVFEIQTIELKNISDVEGGGVINAQENGMVKFLFIPEHGAAPQTPKKYKFGGYVRYWDPYAGGIVTMPLADVELTVNPSPNLMLHYFMERNIISDDPLTKDIIEPTIPSTLAVMVENHGYGPAVNMMISSAQPEIIENEKGLAINFELIGSKFQGKEKNLGVIDINFGTIPPLETRIGEWYLISSLMGKFVSYEADVIHANSYGNPDLSLVKGIEIHELIKTVKAYGPDEDDVNDFLVNDLFDVHNTPDHIYFSQGQRTERVYQADDAWFSSKVMAPTFTNMLIVEPSVEGWNYLKITDPGNNKYEIVSITREDGQVIPLDNGWLTFVTLPTAKSPVYENKFHFVDKFETTDAVEYTVVWVAKDGNLPKVMEISGVEESIVYEKVDELVVTFNKPIDPTTFDYNDLTMTFQGGANIIDSNVSVSSIDDYSFEVDISHLTTGNGFYNFTVQTIGIEDQFGISGFEGENITWSQFLDVPYVESYYGIPENNLSVAFDTIHIQFNLEIDELSLLDDRFYLIKDEVNIGNLTIDSIHDNSKLVYLSGLGNLMIEDGEYNLVIDLPEILSKDGKEGKQEQIIKLYLDNKGPDIISFTKDFTGGVDMQHVNSIDILFDEEVRGFNTGMILLSRNGDPIYLNIAQLSNSDLRNWRVENLGIETYHEGEYKLSVDLSRLKDKLDNYGEGFAELSWVVDRSELDLISNLRISPDLGYSDSDGITIQDNLKIEFDLSEEIESLHIYQVDFGGEIFIQSENDLNVGFNSIDLATLVGGNSGLKLKYSGTNGGVGEATINFFIDTKELTGNWDFVNNSNFGVQISSLVFNLSDRILDLDDFINGLEITHNENVISSDLFDYQENGEKQITISNIDGVSNAIGNYKFSLDMSSISKYSSGLKGTGRKTIQWWVNKENRAPIADVGNNFVVTDLGTYELDGTNSYDEDGDAIIFEWTTESNLIIENSSSSIARIIVDETTPCGEYQFTLTVSDGASTDVANVIVTIDLPTKTYYRDADGDGFGDKNVTIESCVPVDGYVDIAGDCDDSNPAVYPGALEPENDCEYDFSTNISDVENTFNISILPLPFEDEATIRISNNEHKLNSIRVFNNIGMLVDILNVSRSSTEINFGKEYQKGIYFVEVNYDGITKTIKVVKR